MGSTTKYLVIGHWSLVFPQDVDVAERFLERDRPYGKILGYWSSVIGPSTGCGADTFVQIGDTVCQIAWKGELHGLL